VALDRVGVSNAAIHCVLDDLRALAIRAIRQISVSVAHENTVVKHRDRIGRADPFGAAANTDSSYGAAAFCANAGAAPVPERTMPVAIARETDDDFIGVTSRCLRSV
jgi:hypothetical protein